jgi:hypothetical protein
MHLVGGGGEGGGDSSGSAAVQHNSKSSNAATRADMALAVKNAPTNDAAASSTQT